MRQLSQIEIERFYCLTVRRQAVTTMVHAMDYLTAQSGLYGWSMSAYAALELLNDGIKNAIDHRSTGFEFRTLRHTRQAVQDPGNYPKVEERNRRCQQCGGITPKPFSRCPHIEQEKPRDIQAAKGEKL